MSPRSKWRTQCTSTSHAPKKTRAGERQPQATSASHQQGCNALASHATSTLNPRDSYMPSVRQKKMSYNKNGYKSVQFAEQVIALLRAVTVPGLSQWQKRTLKRSLKMQRIFQHRRHFPNESHAPCNYLPCGHFQKNYSTVHATTA